MILQSTTGAAAGIIDLDGDIAGGANSLGH